MTDRTHSVKLDRDKCMGCTSCIKGCPTRAIRVRGGKARILEGLCIDCGECIRICPHHAKSAEMDSIGRLSEFETAVALVPPSLYGQFGAPASRPMILAAVKALGFDDVEEVAAGAERVTEATIAFLSDRGNGPLPVISSACPAVVRLVQVRFPGLLDHLLPLDAPMEVAAREARRRAVSRTGLSPDRVGVFFLSPCAAKRSAVRFPAGASRSEVDGVLSIAEVYPLILSRLDQVDPEEARAFAGRPLAGPAGVRWGNAGGEAVALQTDRFLAVDGIHNVIDILEEIEGERLADVDFIEANACFGGCIGGPLTVANRFAARTRMRRHLDEARSAARAGGPFADPEAAGLQPVGRWTEPVMPNHVLRLDADIGRAMRMFEEMEAIAARLPGLDCGACGAPGCASLAEDIVRGEAAETDCIVLLREQYNRLTTGNSAGLPIHEISDRLGWRILVPPTDPDRIVSGGYACDMLSRVVAGAGPGDAWFTILNSLNVVAVASLAGVACVVLAEGTAMDPPVLARAAEKGVCVLSTDKSTCRAAAALSRLLP